MKKIITCGALAASVSLSALVQANEDWVSYPSDLMQPDVSGQNLEQQWPLLVRATQDEFPESPELQDAWRAHFRGDFAEAKAKGLALGTVDGKYVAYRAQTTYAMYLTPVPTEDLENAERSVLLKEVADELAAAIAAQEEAGEEPSMQVRFWQNYAFARYMDIMKPDWSLFAKKDGVTDLLDGLESIENGFSMPALRATYGGTLAAISEDGFFARRTFGSRVKDCDGERASYADAVVSQYNCALETLAETPFPELLESYAIALDRLGIGDKESDLHATSDAYFKYAQGEALPEGVTETVFMSEDALTVALGSENR